MSVKGVPHELCQRGVQHVPQLGRQLQSVQSLLRMGYEDRAKGDMFYLLDASGQELVVRRGTPEDGGLFALSAGSAMTAAVDGGPEPESVADEEDALVATRRHASTCTVYCI